MKKLIIILIITLFLITFVNADNIYNEYTVDEYTSALWHFNEGNGGIAYDETIYSNDGTIQGATWTSEGKFENALDFDGFDDYIAVYNSGNLHITQSITLEAWIKRGSYDNGTIISKNGPYYLAVRDSKVKGGVYAGSPNNYTWTYAVGTTNLEINTWYHLAMIYDGVNVKVYINGIEDGSQLATGLMPVVSQDVFIGWGEPGQNQYFNGIIDEVRISNVSRTFNTTIPQTLEERVTILEQQVANLTERVNVLEESQQEQNERLDLLEILVNEISESLNNFIEEITSYLTFTPQQFRQGMICKYMRENSLTNQTAFGLQCYIIGEDCRCESFTY